jgi:mRNA-degrading endonuclease RelE of RelBE toxin-antitoxin system
MKWDWELSARAVKDLDGIDAKFRTPMIEGLSLLADEMTDPGYPIKSDNKKLKGMKGHFRLRVGNYRARYTQERRQVLDEKGQPAKGPKGQPIYTGMILVYTVFPRQSGYNDD